MKKIIFVLLFLPFASFGQRFDNALGVKGGLLFNQYYTYSNIGINYSHRFSHLKIQFDPYLLKDKSYQLHFNVYSLPISVGYYSNTKLSYGAYIGYTGMLSFAYHEYYSFLHFGGSLDYTISKRLFASLDLRYIRGLVEGNGHANIISVSVGYKF